MRHLNLFSDKGNFQINKTQLIELIELLNWLKELFKSTAGIPIMKMNNLRDLRDRRNHI